MKKIVIPITAVVLLLFLMFSCSSGNSMLTNWQASIIKSTSPEQTAEANGTVLKYFQKQNKIPAAFLKYLEAAEPVVRQNAIIVLTSANKEWTKKYQLPGKLYPCLKDSDVEVRKQAAIALLKLNGLDKDMNLIYKSESNQEVRSYIAGLIAFSMKHEDLSALKTQMQDASQKAALLVVLENYRENYQEKWASLSDENKIRYVAELVPVLENSVVAVELNEFLQKLTGNEIRLGSTDDEKSLALHQWKSWIVQKKLALLAKKSPSELKIIMDSDKKSLEERFLAATLLAEKDQSAHEFITRILQDKNQYYQVVYAVSPKYYEYFAPHISQKDKNSSEAITFLLHQKDDKGISILNENVTFLSEKYQMYLAKRTATQNTNTQNTNEQNANSNEQNVGDLGNKGNAENNNNGQNVVANNNQNVAGNQGGNVQVQIEQESLQLIIQGLQNELKNNIKEIIEESLQNSLKKNKWNGSGHEAGACVYDNLIELTSKTNEGVINEPYVYEIDVKALQNSGNITVMLIIPEGTTYLRSEPQAEVQDNVLIWNYRVLRENEVQRIKVWLVSNQEGNTPICSFAKASPTCCANVYIGKPIIELSKVGPENALLGEEVTYTITAKNIGTATAKDVVVNDIFLEGFEHESGEYQVTLPVGDLKVKEEKTFNITLRTTQRGMVCNKATVNSSNADAVEAQACTKVLKRDLTIALNCAQEGIVGEKITGTLEFENTGDTVLTNVLLETTFSNGIKILSSEYEGEVSEDKIIWKIDSIPVGEKKTYNVVLTATVEGEHCVHMKMTTGEDIVRETFCCTLWRGVPQLTIIKNGPETAILGSEFSYDITVESVGTTTARDVVIVDVLPGNLSHESGETVLRYPVGDMPIGDKTTITVMVTAVAPGEAKNTARTESSNTDPVEDDAVTIIQRMDAEISLVCVESAKLGERVEFAVTVQNTGDVSLNDFNVAIATPQELTIISGDCDPQIGEGGAVWSIGVLEAGAEKTCKLVVTATAEGNFDLNSTFTSTEKVSKSTNCSTYWVGEPKLEIVKTGPEYALLNSEFEYEIVVKSVGTVGAENVVLVDTLPYNLSHESGERTLIYDLGSIAVGESKTTVVRVTAVEVGEARNAAQASGRRAPAVEDDAVTIIQRMDAEISLVCVESAKLGERVEFAVTVQNTGDVYLNDFNVTIATPQELTIISGDCDPQIGEGGAVWSIGVLEAGAEKTCKLVVTATAEGNFDLNSTFTSTEKVSKSTNCSTYWVGEPKLEIVKTGPEYALLNSEFEYEIVVKSVGTVGAENVVLVDTLPYNLSHESGERTLIYDLGSIAVGESKTTVVRVTAVEVGEARNTAQASGRRAPGVEDDAVTIIQRMDATIGLVCVESAKLGERVEFAVTVQNTGDVSLNGVDVVIATPQELTIISGDCDPQIGEGGAVWSIGVLEAGAEKTCKLVVTATAEGNFDLNSTFTSTEKVSRSANCSTYWVGEPKLEIVKTGPEYALLNSEFEYEIVVKSVGTVGAENVVLVDTLPYNLSHESGERTLIYDLGSIAVGESKTTVVRVTAVEVGEARNTAQASGRRAPGVEDDAVTIIQRMDAEISLVCIENAKLGERIESVLRIQNTGDVPLSEVSIAVAIPQELTIISGDCDPQIGEGGAVWAIGTLEAGAEKTCKLVLTATAEGNLGLESTFTSAEKVSKSANCSTYWIGEPRLEIVKTGPEYVVLGSEFEYEIVVKSVGTVGAENVVLVDLLPYNLSHESGERTLTYDLGNIAVGESKTTVVRVTAVEAGEARNIAQASGKRASGVEDDAITIIQRLSAELNVTCGENGRLGERVDVTVSVTNTGDIVLSDLRVASSAGDNLVLVATDCAPVDSNASLWTIATLAPGETQKCNLTVSAKAQGLLCLQANLTNSQGISESAECCTSWTGEPKLTIVKTGPAQAIVGDAIIYTVKVESVGTIAAEGVVVTDMLPSQLSHESGEQVLRYELGDLAPGETKELTIATKSVEAGNACNIARVESTNAPSEEAQACTELKTLAAELTVKCPPVGYLEKRSPSMVIFQNTGDVELTDIQIKAVSSSDKLHIFPDDEDKKAVVEGNMITWNIEKIAAGKKSAIKIYSVSKYEGDFCIEVTVATKEGISKQESCCSHWKGFPALLLEVIDTEDPVMIGEKSEYQIEVTNQGSADDKNVRIELVMPPETDAIEVSGSTKGTIDGKNVKFEVFPVLKPGEKINFSVIFEGLSEGDSRLRVYLSSETLQKPVLEEESTQVY